MAFINREPKIGETRYFVWADDFDNWEITKVELTSIGKFQGQRDFRYKRKKVVYTNNTKSLDTKMAMDGMYWQFQYTLRDAKRLLFYEIFIPGSSYEREPPW